MVAEIPQRTKHEYMSSIKTTQIDGDVSVGRNVAMGGKAEVAGSAHIVHNLKVDGWLEAPNIKGANKGIFPTVEKLREVYPTAQDGWLAGVGTSTPFAAYTGNNGEWLPTGGTIDITADIMLFEEELDELRDELHNLPDIDDEPTAGSENVVKSGGVEHVIATLIISGGDYLLISKDDNDTSYTITFPSSYYISFGKSVVHPSISTLTFTPYGSQNVTKIVYNIETGDIQAVRRDLGLTSKQVFLFAINVNKKTTTLPIDKYRFATNDDLFSEILNSLTQDLLYKASVMNITYYLGTRIDASGTAVPSTSWSVSEHIHLNAGDYLFFKAVTTTSASLISMVNDTDPVTYTPLFIASEAGTWDAYYHAESAMDVVLCVRYTNISAYKVSSVIISNVINKILNCENQIKNQIENQIETINKTILIDKNTFVDVIFEDGYYINKNGVKTANSSFSMTNIIALSKDETIVVEWKTEGTVIGTISQVIEENGDITYSPLVTSGGRLDDGSRFLFDYYTAIDSCNIVVSTRYKANTKIFKLDKSGIYEFVLRKLNQVFVSIDEIKESIKSYTLPLTWSNKIETLNVFKGKMFSFLIQTDTHYMVGDGEDYGNDVKEMAKNVPFDFVANLGDIIEGYASMTKELYRESMSEIMKRYTEGLPCPFFYTKGNHEHNGMYAGTLSDPTEGYIYDDELWNRTILPSKNTARNIVYPSRSFYYYYDFDDLNVRAIFVNTNDAATSREGIFGFGISDAQLAWFTDVALNTTKAVAIYSHVPLIPNLDPGGDAHNNNASIRQLLEPIKSFVDNGGTVIGCFCGHIHMDAQNTHEGVNHISFDNGPVGNAVLVDQVNRKIYIKSLGYSNDREFTY